MNSQFLMIVTFPAHRGLAHRLHWNCVIIGMLRNASGGVRQGKLSRTEFPNALPAPGLKDLWERAKRTKVEGTERPLHRAWLGLVVLILLELIECRRIWLYLSEQALTTVSFVLRGKIQNRNAPTTC